MTRLRVAIRVPVGRPLPDVAAFIARCEDAGFDGVGIHDHPSSGRDAYLALALAAQATQRLRLFPATSSPVVRHSLVLASLAQSLEEIAPGRICLTVAPGFISTRSIGQPRAGIGIMRDAVSDLRRLLAGEEVGFGATTTRLRNRSATPTPVYLLAAGPRMIELAGEVADGAFLMVGLHPASVRAARQHLEAGARRAGRSLAGFPLVFVVTLGLGPDGDVGARWVRSWFAPGQPFLAYPSIANLRWLKAAGFDLFESHDPIAIPEDRARQIADAFGVFGSPEHCAERLLRAREEAGIEDVFLFPAHDLAGGYTMPEAELQAFARVIRPRLEA
jgi:5,10-methylenetetrahydromethanopterin reductase